MGLSEFRVRKELTVRAERMQMPFGIANTMRLSRTRWSVFTDPLSSGKDIESGGRRMGRERAGGTGGTKGRDLLPPKPLTIVEINESSKLLGEEVMRLGKHTIQ